MSECSLKPQEKIKVPVRESGCFFPRLLLVHDGFWFLSLMIKQPIRRAAMTIVGKKMLYALLELNETNLSVAALTCVHLTPSVGEYFPYNSGMSCDSP